jgi:hypothetical protein
MANSIIRLAILQLRHSAPTNPLEAGFQNESTPIRGNTDQPWLKQDPASTYTTAKFMSELSGIPMNYEEKYPTLNWCATPLNTNPKRKSNFSSCLYQSGNRSGDIVEYYSENSRFDQKGLWLKSS